MVRHGSSNNNNKANATDLVNFHFSSSPPSQSHLAASPPRRNQRSSAAQRHSRAQQQRHSRAQQQRHHRRLTTEDRAAARRKAASSMFYLHSSADHAFVITRRAKQGYTFSGSDEAVSWEAVRTVKYLVPFHEAGRTPNVQAECPVCLDTFVCPRITKCGHCFCLSCLLRHVHTQAETNRSQAAKCPCCGIPVHMNDVRLVTLESIQSPRIHGKVKLTKLHRSKTCPSPYLPRRGAFGHSSPHAAPTVSDADAPYSRFNYVDTDVYLSQLSANQVELESALSELQRHQTQHSSVAMEMIFVEMALESVKAEQQRALEESKEERTLSEQYRQPHAGMYQPLSDRLFATEIPSVKQDTPEKTPPTTRARRAEFMDSSADGSSAGQQQSSGGPSRHERQLPTPDASMYLDEEATHFYQCADGQLCFLSRFNMSCLLEEFTASLPENVPECGSELSPAQIRRLRPLPDVIEGVVLEVESVHLTPQVRKRMHFLSHLPLYSDIRFVELDLNRLLSPDTKQKFKGEMEKRRKNRKKKVTVEKRADRIAKQKEEARINELKARIQRIDPNDEFFQVAQEPPAPVLVGEEFGPSISGNLNNDDVEASQESAPPSELPMSFSAVTVSNLNPMAVTEESFPSLSASPPTRPSHSTWSVAPGWHGRPRAKSVEEETVPDEPTAPGGRKGKKPKSKKVLLFSTGGHRGAA